MKISTDFIIELRDEINKATDRERAALAWAEAVTRVSETHVPDEVFEKAKKHFTEKELADLTLAVGTIHVWNRLAIPGRRSPPT